MFGLCPFLIGVHFFVAAAQAGIGLTDPNPLYHPDRLTMFDPSPPPTLDKSEIPSKVLRVVENLLRALGDVCDSLCQVYTLYIPWPLAAYTRTWSCKFSCIILLSL